MYDLPSRDDVVRCVIDRNVVLDKVHPTLITADEERKRSLDRTNHLHAGSARRGGTLRVAVTAGRRRLAR